MSTLGSEKSQLKANESNLEAGYDIQQQRSIDDVVASFSQDLMASEGVDQILDMKVRLVNQAINEIGWTGYHWKLSFLNGLGYAVDSMTTLLQALIARQAFIEFGATGYPTALALAVFIGMIVGAIFWGFVSDIIGRRYAFNISLFICSGACLISGAMPNWGSLAFFVSLIGFGAGGGLVLDTTIFLEFLPSKQRWVLTLMACWWGIGQTIAGLIAWGFLSTTKWNCVSPATCTYGNNTGWRYTMYTGGALVFAMSCLRITVIRLSETPKYLLAANKDTEVVATLRSIAAKYKRECSLTLEQLEACGVVQSTHARQRLSTDEVFLHVRGLFATKKLGLSTSLVWAKWAIIGLAAPLFFVFLPNYLASRGAELGSSAFEVWRDYVLNAVSGTFGPVLASYLCSLRFLGRRYTMAIGALISMIFFFAYTSVRSAAQNSGFSCAISFAINVYYAPLFAYTPEVLPTAHRSTGYGIGISLNKLMGVVCAVVGGATNPSSSLPIYICASLFAILVILSGLLPFEPQWMETA